MDTQHACACKRSTAVQQVLKLAATFKRFPLTGYSHLGADDLVVGIQVLQCDLLPLTPVCKNRHRLCLEQYVLFLAGRTPLHHIRLLMLVVVAPAICHALL